MRFLAFSILLLALCRGNAIGAESSIPIEPPAGNVAVDFERDVLPILRANCAACHNARKREGGLSLETPQTILQGGDRGPAIAPGKGVESLLLNVASHREESFMPPSNNAVGARNLTPRELGLIKLWIDGGAGGGVSARQIRWQPAPGRYRPIFAVAVTPDGQYAACSRGNRLHVYRVPTATLVANLADPGLAGDAHQDFVRALAFDPAGDLLASGGFREVKLWRRPRVAQMADQTHAAPVSAVAMTADGHRNAAADEGGMVRIFETASNRELFVLDAHGETIAGLVFSPDGTVVYSASRDKTLRAWRIADGAPLGSSVDVLSPPTSLAVSQDGKSLVTGHADGFARTWDASSEWGESPAAPAMEVKTSDQAVTAVVALPGPDREFLAGSEDGVVRRYAENGGEPKATLRRGSPIDGLAASLDGRRIAASGGGRVTLWSAADGAVLAELAADPRGVAGVAQVDGQLFFAKAGVDHAQQDIKSYEGPERRVMTTAEAVTKAQEEQTKANAARDEKQAALEKSKAESKDAQALEAAQTAAADAVTAAQVAVTIVSRAQAIAERAVQDFEAAKQDLAAREARVQQFEAALAAAQAAQRDARPALRGVAFTADNQRLMVGSENGALFAFSAETGAALETLAGHGGKIRALAAGAGTLITAGDEKRIIVWSVASEWKLERTIGGDEQPEAFADRVLTIDFSPDGRALATGGGAPSLDGELKVWNVADGALVREFPGAHADAVFAVHFSPDGQTLASAGADRLVKLFDAQSGQLRQTFAGHTAHVLGLAWQSDGARLASCGADRVLKLWDVKAASLRYTMKGTTYQIGPYKGEVTAATFIGASEQILAAAGDGTVRLHRSTSENDILTFGGAAGYQNAVAATPDGRKLVAGGADGVLRIWSRFERDPKQSFPPPADR